MCERNERFLDAWNRAANLNSPSDYDYEIIRILTMEGWTQDDIRKVCYLWREKYGENPIKVERDGYWWGTTDKARQCPIAPWSNEDQIAICEAAYQLLKPNPFRVLHCLFRHANNGGYCYPTQKTIADECHIKDPKAVRAALNDLEEKRLIRIEKRKNPNGGFENNVYWLLVPSSLSFGIEAARHDLIPIGVFHLQNNTVVGIEIG